MIIPEKIPKDKLFDETVLDNESLWTTNFVHDPAIIKDGNWYYVFSTDAQFGQTDKAGIQIRKSQDLMNWQWVGRALDDVPKDAEEWTGAKGLWAPEIVKYGNTYYMYYAASQFGKTQSFIGVATSDTIEGPYTDLGEVFKSRQDEEGPNAIDANICFDKDEEPWMVYGSFFGGLYVNKINQETGKLLKYGRGKLIAKRHESVERAIEGPYIVYNPEFDYYYLFVSYDSLFSDYNIRVARSKSIEGPYLDFHDNDMTNTTLPPNDVGLKLLGGYKFNAGDGWVAPGHNSVLKDNDDYYVCHHVRAEKNKRWHYLHIRKIIWTKDGWPLISPERFAGEQDVTVNMADSIGEWELIRVDKNENEQNHALKLKIQDDNHENYWIDLSDNYVTLVMKNKEVTGVISECWDWEKEQKSYVFMGKDLYGTVYLAKKIG
ncbi:arabinan endo-1,5-alpha-L-arabinosidase [Paraliobacillus sediminis]|uniref:arabinan endo-1,5-alpha-L-arabinosidase n=1 Tax=Paraliobacillus sediminis TaxID=1885916 RepID=UPI000E3C8871|nr:arabinan endo-1,5-alpha-L-arabinosidase [Paraliobacillus sediminis]